MLSPDIRYQNLKNLFWASYFTVRGIALLLEHFNIFCSHLGRREDEAGKEDCTAILKYCEQI